MYIVWTYLLATLQLPSDPDSLGDIELTAILHKLRVQQTTGPTQLVQLKTSIEQY